MHPACHAPVRPPTVALVTSPGGPCWPPCLRAVGGPFYGEVMLESAHAVAFVPATGLDRARDFYEGTPGLQVQDVSGFACVFRMAGATLRVAQVSELAPQPFTVLGWEIRAIHETIAGLAARGVQMIRYKGMDQDPAGVWTTPGGDQVAWFRDPDGNVLSLTQHGG
jgi:catechol 2,3-dioxygenase-like lactoylglutathione lyase family enzyme